MPLLLVEAGMPLLLHVEAGMPLLLVEAGMPLLHVEAGMPLLHVEAGMPLLLVLSYWLSMEYQNGRVVNREAISVCNVIVANHSWAWTVLSA
jgi:hypothetical protein